MSSLCDQRKITNTSILDIFSIILWRVYNGRLICDIVLEAGAIYSLVEASSCNNDRRSSALIHGDLCNMANNTLSKTCLNYESNGGRSLKFCAEQLWCELMEHFVPGIQNFYEGQYPETHSSNKFTCL